jgi:hypothetical protein
MLQMVAAAVYVGDASIWGKLPLSSRAPHPSMTSDVSDGDSAKNEAGKYLGVQ